MKGRKISSKGKWCIDMFRCLNLAFLFVSGLFFGCASERPPSKQVTLATTTSTQDSGLLDVLLPDFERESGVKVKVIAVGSGQALELGRRGDADILLTHSPQAEKKFMEEGWGGIRQAVMHNDFVIVGPAEDRLEIKKARAAADAFKIIAEARHPFVSRSDESGTHQKEMSIWKTAGVDPDGTWYIRAGAGMAQALRMAHEKKACVLCDRATYLTLKNEIELIVLLEGDQQLLNFYSIITVNPEKHSHVHHDEANRFVEFLMSPNAKKIIGSFGVELYGQALFVPDAKNALESDNEKKNPGIHIPGSPDR
jgi:tungstate transport system substrate-binding protein